MVTLTVIDFHHDSSQMKSKQWGSVSVSRAPAVGDCKSAWAAPMEVKLYTSRGK